MNGDGSGQHELFHESNRYSDGAYPAWSPDGTTIAFVANNGSGYYHVWSVPAGGGQNVELITNKPAGSNPVDEEVDWQAAPGSSAPRTRITRVRIGKRAASFAFEGTGPATGYRCQLRQGKHRTGFSPCRSPRTYAGLGPGRYVFSVRAFGPDEPYPRAVTHGFRIR
jgi:hypothetical protein